MTTGVLLNDRGIIEVTVAESGKFLHSLVTNDVLSLYEDQARFAALLSPQGKILADFFIFLSRNGSYFIDCPRSRLDELFKRLTVYKLRAPIALRDRSAELAVYACLDPTVTQELDVLAQAPDPRAIFGHRLIASSQPMKTTSNSRPNYEARRIALCLPAGDLDFSYNDAFPHEANMDWLNGLDFNKGCYVGQEVVSRMKHRGSTRKRILRYQSQGPAVEAGATILAGSTVIGVTGSSANDNGLAMIRLDRLAEAQEKGQNCIAGAAILTFDPLKD